MRKVTWSSVLFFIVLLITKGVCWAKVWGNEGLPEEKTLTYHLVFFGLLIAAFVLHELVHGVAWCIASGCGWKNISFGVIWKYLTPYCHCDVPMKMTQYIIGGLAPLIVVGLVPLIAGFCTHNYIITQVGVFLTAGAWGDIMMVAKLWKEPKDKLVKDHPTELGCIIYE